MLVLALLPLVMGARPVGEAARWKINTHLYAANLALQDAKDGMVTIPPYGELPVAPAALRALNAYPAAYRAGVLAPDLFPDMFVGGWYVHSDLTESEDWIADNWLRHVWNRARGWSDASEKDKVMAFAYGFVTHGAGDMFAHTWVNEKANGAWVSFWNKDRETAFKHIVLEGYVGEHTPDSELSLDVWPRFVSNVMIKDPVARAHSKSVVYYHRWVAMYNALEPLIEKAKRDMNGTVGSDAPYWAKCAANPVACARKEQAETWRLDINRGLRAMVDSSESLGDKLMDGDAGDGFAAMTGWAKEWLPKIYGVHAFGEGTKAMQEFLDWADKVVPIDEIIKKEVEEFLEHTFPSYWAIYEAAKNPSTYMDAPGFFPPGTKTQVNAEMGLTTPSADFNWRRFEPIYNTVTLSKLALLDGDGLNELARRAGITERLFVPGENTNIMLGVFRSMTQSFQWVGDSVEALTTKFGICGHENMKPLAMKDLCGIPYRRAMSADLARMGGTAGTAAGFVLFGHPGAREKIFNIVFKGFGPGPGPAGNDPRLIAELPPTSAAGIRDGRRAVRVATGETEYMKELVAVMKEKVTGTPAAVSGRQPLTTRAPVAVQSGASPGNVGQRCCAKDIAELRAALAQLQATTPRLNPAVMSRLGRRPTTSQISQRVGLITGALNAFEGARDATVALAAINYIATHVDALTAIAAGTQ